MNTVTVAGSLPPGVTLDLVDAVQSVTIDVLRDSVNLASNGVITVALVTTATFDAALVDVGSVVFAGAHVHQSALEDVDGDGDLDRVLHFRTQDTNLRALYEQLLAEGYAVSRNRATASVASTLPTSGVPAPSRSKPGDLPPVSAYARRLTTLLGTPPARQSRAGARYDFRYGEPSVDEFPREIWRRLVAARARRPARDALKGKWL